MLDVKIRAPGTKAREKHDERQLQQAFDATHRFFCRPRDEAGHAEEAAGVLHHGFDDWDADGNIVTGTGTPAERMAHATECLSEMEKRVSDAKAKMEAAQSVLSPEKRAEYDQHYRSIDLYVALAEAQLVAIRDWLLNEIQKRPAN